MATHARTRARDPSVKAGARREAMGPHGETRAPMTAVRGEARDPVIVLAVFLVEDRAIVPVVGLAEDQVAVPAVVPGRSSATGLVGATLGGAMTRTARPSGVRIAPVLEAVERPNNAEGPG